MRPSRAIQRSIRTYATYQAPLKAGALPAYDQALAYIEQDRKSKLEKLELLRKQKEVDKSVLEKLEVEAWANDPETRWRAATGNGVSSSLHFSVAFCRLEASRKQPSSSRVVLSDWLDLCCCSGCARTGSSFGAKRKRSYELSLARCWPEASVKSSAGQTLCFNPPSASTAGAQLADDGRRMRADPASNLRTGDMSKPVYRHLAERKWRKDGDLAILVSRLLPRATVAELIPRRAQMQRVTQMSVTPDVLPSVSPVADVRIAVGGETLVPGVFTLPGAVSSLPLPDFGPR